MHFNLPLFNHWSVLSDWVVSCKWSCWLLWDYTKYLIWILILQPGTRTGGQQRQQLCSVRPGKWSAQPGGRAERGSGEVKDHPGVWEGDWLVEPLPAFPEAKATGGNSTRSRGPPTLLPSSKVEVHPGGCLGRVCQSHVLWLPLLRKKGG